jgi:hypothetical protein
MHEQAPPHGQGLGVALALDHFIVILRAERDWLAATLPRLQVQVQEGIVEQTILEIDHAAHHD